MFPVFDLTTCSEHCEISDLGIINFFWVHLFFFPLFFFRLCNIWQQKSWHHFWHKRFFFLFVFSSFSLKLSYFSEIPLSKILHFLVCSFVRFFVPYLWYISFKIKWDRVLTPKPLCTFSYLAKTHQFFLILSSKRLHLCIFQLILDTFYIYKKKKIIFFLNWQIFYPVKIISYVNHPQSLFIFIFFKRLKNHTIAKLSFRKIYKPIRICMCFSHNLFFKSLNQHYLISYFLVFH